MAEAVHLIGFVGFTVLAARRFSRGAAPPPWEEVPFIRHGQGGRLCQLGLQFFPDRLAALIEMKPRASDRSQVGANRSRLRSELSTSPTVN